MSRTRSKELEIVTTEESQSYKRGRMADIRQMVAAAHKKGKRIDLIGFKGTDIPRSQIALQDLLSKEQEKHARARKHIIRQKEFINIISEMSQLVSEDATRRLTDDQHRMTDLSVALRNEQKLHNMANKAVQELLAEKEHLTSNLEDTMNTLRVALNGSTNG